MQLMKLEDVSDADIISHVVICVGHYWSHGCDSDFICGTYNYMHSPYMHINIYIYSTYMQFGGHICF